ncbi:type II toxin-antitoxin system RelE/ParE family toxin [Parabacteroides johnsonii]|uniref:type II toxin-antitoxin system RelE/ParE family toxin n=1 Tax=Parabacteroides johnsonii TaxID=387661 RepID=UPI001C390905|nr:type II toxin-antitoxin system RelE/ParE family toxin [Parabacteroides johnsonii]MBV4245845.1 type II toxin-antitoxin system RelE/ParE family toxin [Parabacteroides johnsonii]
MDVIWTSPAEKSFAETLYYIRLRTGDRSAHKVWQMIKKQADLLAMNPYMGKVDSDLVTGNRQYRFVIVNKRSKIYYFIEGDNLYIALIMDTRQDLRDIKEKLSTLF